MAIQLPNPGLGDGQTGDNEFVMWTKVKDNFSNTTHAASRLVGTADGNVAEMGFYGVAQSGFCSLRAEVKSGDIDKPSVNNTSSLIRYSSSTQGVFNYRNVLNMPYATGASSGTQLSFSIDASPRAWIRVAKGGSVDEYTLPAEFYTTANTTKDTATGFLKASSPVLHVYNDSITKIHEAEQLDITVDKKGVGHYEIHGTTGLRKNDGWFMSPPRDVHGNVLCMVDLDEKDGVIILKTYKKKFDFETVAIVHDWDNPMDIPEGVCVEFRFNDLPEEQLDEPIE